jgi:drug/metabolite transporter (DMT)-like permease
MFVASWANAAMNICNRELKDVHFTVIMAWHGLLGFTVPLIVILIYCAVTSQTLMNYTSAGYFWLFMGGVADVCTCMFNVIAFQSYNPGFVSLMMYCSVFYAFIADIFIFKISVSGF